MTSPYEASVVKQEPPVALHVDAYYKLVGPPNTKRKTDYRRAPQFLCLSGFQRDIEKHILLRGMFAKPTTTETYCYFFETLFAEHGFPGSLGLVVDFDTTQILGIIHAYYRVKYKGKEDQLNKNLAIHQK